MIERPVPEITPEVTVFANCPRALPIAITCWPTAKVFESPRAAAGRFSASFIFRKAMSFSGSTVIRVES